jgi:hypothetical protein
MEFDKKGLLNLVLDQFKLNRDGYHGPSHWARVRVHALEIGQITIPTSASQVCNSTNCVTPFATIVAAVFIQTKLFSLVGMETD